MNTTQDHACAVIEQAAPDFTAAFYAAFEIGALARENALDLASRAIDGLRSMLLRNAFERQRQRFFLYREAAGALTAMMRFVSNPAVSSQAQRALWDLLRHGGDQAHRAVAESLGNLPIAVRGPSLPQWHRVRVPRVTWNDLMNDVAAATGAPVQTMGRSLVVDLGQDRVAVVKLARGSQEHASLVQELRWMAYLNGNTAFHADGFDIPVMHRVQSAPLFRLARYPTGVPRPDGVGDSPHAVCFIASSDYFCYPNGDGLSGLPKMEAFMQVMGRNAYLLGHLAGHGIVHTAPIPLFHNRVQQERRRDGGAYEWFRAGRLDRWLDSCAYPNIGFTGLRDFEHLVSFSDRPIDLYRLIGNHVLSLLLVSASYFRAKDPKLRGKDAHGNPIDARALFDPSMLCRVADVIFRTYIEGFTGTPAVTELPVDTMALAMRMVDEMGVDRHMEEVLRQADQLRMSRTAFERFLRERGVPQQRIAETKQGCADLVVQTGPHLGAFNRGISIPELIEAAASVAAACFLNRYCDLHPRS